jgi:GntR family transcriptional regulator/MocR family aminotransferase
LHLVAYLPDDLDETAVRHAAAERGVAVHGLAPYRLSGAGRPGLIFGYATLERADDPDGRRAAGGRGALAAASTYISR